MNTLKHIVIVDDEPLTRQGLKRMLESHGAGRYEVTTVDNGWDALKRVKAGPCHLLITDIRMPEINGLNLVDSLASEELPSRPSIILISGYAEFDYAQQAIRLGVCDYLLKPVRKEKLFAAVEMALELEEERNRLTQLERMMDQKLAASVQPAGQPPLNPAVEEALGYVEAHLSESFGLREAAQFVHLNPSYFSVLFKEQMQMNFTEYVTRKRLQKAKQLLLQTSLPIAEIAEQVGYQTPKYFCKVFKEYEGFNPGSYRSGDLDRVGQLDKARGDSVS